jgi:hypothetical protein
MRSFLRAALFATSAASMAACAALTGLDSISEDACVPNLCPDVVVSGSDALPADDASGNTSRWEGSSAADVISVDDVVSVEETSTEDAGIEASVDAAPDGSLDASPDTPADGATVVEAAPDAPCGTVYLSESFDGDAGGWTLDDTWSIAPTCAAPPAPQKGNPDPTVDHTTGTASGIVGAYVCGNNPSGTTSTFRYATSPAVDVSAAPTLELRFYRWLNTDADGWMASTVDVYDGTAWVNVFTNPSGEGNLVTDSAWTLVEYDVTAQKNPAFQVRFGYEVTDAGVYSMSCWNVDDLMISTAACP